jgi:hypothetical protein
MAGTFIIMFDLIAHINRNDSVMPKRFEVLDGYGCRVSRSGYLRKFLYVM